MTLLSEFGLPLVIQFHDLVLLSRFVSDQGDHEGLEGLVEGRIAGVIVFDHIDQGLQLSPHVFVLAGIIDGMVAVIFGRIILDQIALFVVTRPVRQTRAAFELSFALFV